MAWTTPTSRSTGNLITASIWNTDLVDNLIYLKSAINPQIQISGAGMLPRITGGSTPTQFETSLGRNYAGQSFPYGSTASADFSLVLPSDYDGGTMTAIFHWTANSTSTNSVKWFIYMAAVADDGTLDMASATSQNVTDANKASAYDLNITAATPAVTIGGSPSAGKKLWGRVYRTSDASDTLAVDAILLDTILTYSRT